MTRASKKYKVNERNGLIVKGFRLQNSITRKQLSKTLGVCESSISEWELGYRPLPEVIFNTLKTNYNLRLERPKYNRKHT